MPFLKTPDNVNLFYNDWGNGPPVVLIHGWPLDGDMWSEQATYLAENGMRVIAYDRRGFGRSDQPWNGYDYDTLAADLDAIIKGLNLQRPALVGFSMGGGEVARYVSRFGPGGVAKAVLVSAVTPYMLKTEDNPDGVDKSVFDEITEGIKKDRAHFFTDFNKKFFGNSMIHDQVSEEVLAWSQQIIMMAWLRATLQCGNSFATTDFRKDLAAFTMPTLIIHGTSDKTVPIDASARPAAKLLPHATLIEYDGEPHGLFITAKDRLNLDLLTFLRS